LEVNGKNLQRFEVDALDRTAFSRPQLTRERTRLTCVHAPQSRLNTNDTAVGDANFFASSVL